MLADRSYNKIKEGHVPCPNCGSHDLWDDNMAWGCETCHWMSIDGSTPNSAHHEDKMNGEVNWPGKPKAPMINWERILNARQ